MVLDSEARNGNKGVSSLTRGRALAWKAGSRKGHFLPEKASGEQSKALGCLSHPRKEERPAWLQQRFCLHCSDAAGLLSLYSLAADAPT